MGSAESTQYDQVLEHFVMENLAAGELTFEIKINPPEPDKIPKDELLGASLLMICAIYRKQEFFR